MNSKDPSISSLLDRPHLQSSHGGVLPSDPVIPTRIHATLDQIVAYKDNPRHTKNPMYDEIKESIRNRGLDHAPNVTRQNPADPYMIKDGGNTRLQILRELWEETGNEKFYHLDLMFHPWTNDLDVLIGHMIENEMRGNMIFIERAIAARKVKNQIEDEGGKELSIRELAKRITEMGWSTKDTNLNQMLYAEEFLLQVMPDALWSGIGIDRVKKIRKLLDCCRTYWESVSTIEEGDFDGVWQPLFRKLDGDGFDVSAAEYQLCGEMAKRMGDAPVLSVTAQIQGLLEGIKGMELVRPSRFEPTTFDASPRASKPPATKPGQPPRIETAQSPRNLPLTQQAGENSSGVSIDNTQPTFDQSTNALMNAPASGQDPQFSPESLFAHPGGSSMDFLINESVDASLGKYQYLVSLPTAFLQNRAYEIALSYAHRVGLQDNIISTQGRTDLHMGFYVTNTGLGGMGQAAIAHWTFLSQFAFIRNANSAGLLVENMVSELGSNFDTLNTISLIMSMTYARADLMGNRIRSSENPYVNDMWEDITELEAITGIILTRDFDESTRVDEVPDPTFAGQ